MYVCVCGRNRSFTVHTAFSHIMRSAYDEHQMCRRRAWQSCSWSWGASGQGARTRSAWPTARGTPNKSWVLNRAGRKEPTQKHALMCGWQCVQPYVDVCVFLVLTWEGLVLKYGEPCRSPHSDALWVCVLFWALFRFVFNEGSQRNHPVLGHSNLSQIHVFAC